MRYIDGKPIGTCKNLTEDLEVQVARKIADMHSIPVYLEWILGGNSVDRIISRFLDFVILYLIIYLL